MATEPPASEYTTTPDEDMEDSPTEGESPSTIVDSIINEEQDHVDETPKEKHSDDLIDLHEGSGFTPSSAYEITSANQSQLIMLAGAHRCGKTTLLASIYELFRDEPLAGYLFAGSLTLPGFEMRCHLARISSGMPRADTERTKPADDTLLHLRVCRTDLGESALDLLFTDLAGERFRMAKDSMDECRRLKILRRVDHFVLLIDGAKLAAPEYRHQAYLQEHSLLRSCLDAGMLGSHTYVDILFTKWDLVMPLLEEEALLKFLETIEAQLTRNFEDRVGRLRFFRVAARPNQKAGVPFGYNLDQLVSSWIEAGPVRRYYEVRQPVMPDSAEMREIQHFMLIQSQNR